MFDYENQTEAVKALVDEAAYMLWRYTRASEIVGGMAREKRRASRKMVGLAEESGRCRGKMIGIERAMSDLLGVDRRELRDAVATRALVLYGPAEGRCRA